MAESVRWRAARYTHAPGSTDNLSFPVTITNGKYYEIVFTQTGTNAANNFNLVFAAGAAGTSGHIVKNGVYYSTTFVIQATGNYSFLNVVPASGWGGTFTLTSVKEAVNVNSESMSVKGRPIIVGSEYMISGSGGKLNTGRYNDAYGINTLLYNTTGISNTAIGHTTLYNNTTGAGNVASGYYALGANTTGGNNTAIGNGPMSGNVTGNGNTAIGANALLNNVTGSNNTALGASAGRSLSDGSQQSLAENSVFIGVNTKGSTVDNQINQTVIGYNAIGNGSNTITLGNNQIERLYCQVTEITKISDKRVKEDIGAADIGRCLDTVKSLPVTRYKYKDFTGKRVDKHVTGFLADDMETVFPKSVSVSDRYFPVLDENGEQVYEEITETVTDFDEDGNEVQTEETRLVPQMFLMKDVKDITPTELVPTLWGAVQALTRRVEALEKLI